MSVDNTHIVKWEVDASYAVHPDMKGHTGATMTLGKGAITSLSNKQKINTRSSTESELVGTDKSLGTILWTQKFLDYQEYDIHYNEIDCDNLSTKFLEENGKNNSSRRTRHFDIRFFLSQTKLNKETSS